MKIYGGEMTAGAAAGGGFVLSTRLPLDGGAGMSIRVLVADDQSMVRAGFRMLLGGEPDIEVVAEAGNGLEAVDKAARFDPTVILMDIRMPELDGLEATRRILAADAAARILILTTFDLDEYVYEALQRRRERLRAQGRPARAADRRDPHGRRRRRAALARGHEARDPRSSRACPRPTPPKELDELTAREHEIFRLIAEGLSNAEIAQELYISETTVKTHVTHILQKLGLRDRVQAVVLAYQTGCSTRTRRRAKAGAGRPPATPPRSRRA